MHELNSEGFEISTIVLSLPHEAATQALAQNLATAARDLITKQLAPAGLTLHLKGELGAGKTTFVRYFLQTLGVAGRIKSPTYGLAESYEFAPNLEAWHFDFYRLEKPLEWSESGFTELWFRPVLRLVEWPQNAGLELPSPHLMLDLTWRDEPDKTQSSTEVTSTARIAHLNAVNALGGNWLNVSNQ
jgi:tRNA threonylcarbamoyladenosine biosynthesis protein TsaE